VVSRRTLIIAERTTLHKDAACFINVWQRHTGFDPLINLSHKKVDNCRERNTAICRKERRSGTFFLISWILGFPEFYAQFFWVDDVGFRDYMDHKEILFVAVSSEYVGKDR
jgi:hypothetical protein